MSKTNQGTYINIPTEIFQKVENPVDAIVYGYIQGWMNYKRTSKVSLHAGCQRIAETINVSVDTVTRSLRRLTDAGLISCKRYPTGYWLTTNTDMVKAWEKAKVIPQNAESLGEVIPQNAESKGYRKMRNHSGEVIPQNADTIKSKILDLESQNVLHLKDQNPKQKQQTARVLACEASPESEPLASPVVVSVSVSQSPLLIPNGYTAKPMRGQVVLTQAQANLAAQLLGASGEDIKAHLIFTPEQSAKEGFIECCLKSAIDRRKSIKGSAFAYLRGIVAGSWNDGKWVDPAIEAERAKQAEKDARAERLRRISAL